MHMTRRDWLHIAATACGLYGTVIAVATIYLHEVVGDAAGGLAAVMGAWS